MNGPTLIRKLNELLQPQVVGRRWCDTPFPIINKPDYGPDGRVEGWISSLEKLREGIDHAVRGLGENPSEWRFEWQLDEDDPMSRRGDSAVRGFRIVRAFRLVPNGDEAIHRCIFTNQYFMVAE